MKFCKNRKFCYMRFQLFVILAVTTCSIKCDWKQHKRYQKGGPSRNRRQLDNGPQQVDLNITVPFIFSARLYPYGTSKGDTVWDPNKANQPLNLKNDLIYFGRNYSSIYIGQDGVIWFEPNYATYPRQAFPTPHKSIAVYWTPVDLTDGGKIYYREAEDDSIIQLAGNEIQLQYQYNNDFKPKSVLIVTWENVSSPLTPKGLPSKHKNLFQAAFILGSNETFAHMIYSKLKWHNDAIAGFNDGDDNKKFYNLPWSNSANVVKLANESDIGIPGEWLFKVDGPVVHLCGPGFKGLECVDRCQKIEYSYDCDRRCHCDNNEPCHLLSGICPQQGRCARGWKNSPVCDVDEDECAGGSGAKKLCSGRQPDCVNTPGSYSCTCLTGYDNATNTCFGHAPENNSAINSKLAPAPSVLGQQQRPTDFQNVVEQQNSADLPVTIASNVIVPNFGGSSGLSEVAFRLPGGLQQPNSVEQSSTKQPSFTSQLDQSGGTNLFKAQSIPLSLKSLPPVVNLTVNSPLSTVLKPVNNITSNNNNNTLSTNFSVVSSKNNASIDREVVAILPQILIPETLAPILPPGIPFLSTKSVSAITTTHPALCDLQCNDNAHCEFQHSGSMKCACNRGWSGDGSFCIDINECLIDNACESNAKCQNTIGSYNCLCEPGFQSDGKNCVDINECVEDSVQCPGGNRSICANTPGSYECRCAPGYNGNPTSLLSCIDINECLIPDFYCGPNAECENLPGSFQCHCHSGYQRNADATDCEDIDECKISPCSGSANCRNLPGSFSCTCLDGFSGDGLVCQGTILYPFSRTEDKRLPQEKNALVEVKFPMPVKLLGKEFSQIFVSANGIVTFDRAMELYSELPVSETRRLGFAPLYQKIDLTRGGGVFIKMTTEYLALAKATNSVLEDFHEYEFKAGLLIVVTFDDVIQINEHDNNKRSTFQLILVTGEQGTYVTYVYDRISNENAQAAVVAPEPPRSVVLPVSGLNASLLKESSNINVPGKWMYRVDERLVQQCPGGTLGPPYCQIGCEAGSWGQSCAKSCQCADNIPCDFKTGYCSNHQCLPGFTGDNCQQDIDECKIPQRLCHQRAACLNTVGSFHCKCDLGWTGDGFQCFEITPCLLISQTVCGENAGCFVPSNGSNPSCICNVGYFGDGYLCTSAKATLKPLNLINSTFQTEDETTDELKNFTSTTHLTITNSTESESLTNSTTTIAITSTTSAALVSQTTSKTPDLQTVVTPVPEPEPEPEPSTAAQQQQQTIKIIPKSTANFGIEFNRTPLHHPLSTSPPESDRLSEQNSLNKHNDHSKPNKRLGLEAVAPTNLLIIVVPAVLCGVWLLLVVVLFIVCFRKRKQKQRDKYGNGYYLPSSNGATGTSVNPNYNIYGSQWNVPRPVYDYYTGYYPDYYSTYKY